MRALGPEEIAALGDGGGDGGVRPCGGTGAFGYEVGRTSGGGRGAECGTGQLQAEMPEGEPFFGARV